MKKSVYWRRLPDGRYEVGFSHDEQHEPVSVAGNHVGFYAFPTSIADEMREEHRRRVLCE